MTGAEPLWRDDLMNNRGTPIIGLGAASQVWDLRTAGIGFCAGVAVLAAAALAALQLLRRRDRG